MSKVNFVTATGRVVQGSLHNPKTHDDKGVQLVYKSGASIGQPRVEYYFGLAIPKTDPGCQELLNIMGQAAGAAWPNGEANAADFSWKFIDGDSLDKKGQPYSAREGHAGCMIFKFTGSFAPRCSVLIGPNNWAEIQPEAIKTGDYIRVSGNCEGNKSTQSPGIYMNYDQVEHMGVGEAISSGPSAADAFGQAPAAALPAGATAPPPPAAAVFAQPAAVAAPMAAPVAAPMAAPVAAPVAAPIAPQPAAAPHPGFAQPPVA